MSSLAFYLKARITISASISNPGTILSANHFTTRLFGYLPSQIERRNCSMIIPPPMAAAHDFFLRTYLETGSGRVVDSTRIIFGLHKEGHIFPLLMSVHEAVSHDGSLVFVGTMRALATTEEHIILDDNSRVLACSLQSLGLLDISVESLTGSSLKGPLISGWVSEWDMIQVALECEEGTTLFVSPRCMPGGIASAEAKVVADDCAIDADAGVWIHAHLQRVTLPTNEKFAVLHWTRKTKDAYTVRH